jgi:tetratricopeptide (TPR) repeat protein
MRALAAALGLVMLTLGAPALAQREPNTAAVSVDQTVRRVVAQYQAALIRERRLADARALTQISAAEDRMRDARRSLVIARSDRSAAEAALESARAEYVRLVNSVPLLEASARIELEAFRAELENNWPEATSELIAAYQEFADGDRVTAWTSLQALLEARARARLTAARAVAAGELRQLANLREVMRINSEATTASVLALWDQASELDSQHFRTQIARSRLARGMNRMDVSLAAAERARALSSTDQEAYLALFELMVTARELGNVNAAYAAAEEMLATARRLFAANPRNGVAQDDYTSALIMLADISLVRGDQSRALSLYQIALDNWRNLYAANPGNIHMARRLTISLERTGSMLRDRGDLSGAMAHYNEGLDLSRALYAADPSNVDLTRDLLVSLERAGDVLRARNDRNGALAHYREGQEIAHRLYIADPTSAAAARDRWIFMWWRAQLGDFRWRDVVAAIEESQRRGLFEEARYGAFLVQARARAAAE